MPAFIINAKLGCLNYKPFVLMPQKETKMNKIFYFYYVGHVIYDSRVFHEALYKWPRFRDLNFA